MPMFRRIRKGWEIEANGVLVKVVSGRASVTIVAERTIKIDVRPPKKRQTGLQVQKPRS